MKLINHMFALLTLVAPLSAATHYHPVRDATSNVNISNYGVWLNPSDGSSILRFESTVILVQPSSNETVQNNVQAVWPGLETKDFSGLLQNVITNQNGKPGEWTQLPYYCCHPAGALVDTSTRLPVNPGDSVTNTYSLDTGSGHWYNNWVVTPSVPSNGTHKAYGGGLIFDPAYDTTTKGSPFTHVIMSIELQQQGTWDFGQVEWKHIIIEANTTDSKWCTNGPLGGNSFTFEYTPPHFHTMGNTTWCYIAHMIFMHPNN